LFDVAEAHATRKVLAYIAYRSVFAVAVILEKDDPAFVEDNDFLLNS
jgi:hypothetical protein